MKTFEDYVRIHGFDHVSLEDLATSIHGLRDAQGLYLGCRPKDVLQPWILQYFPKPLDEITKTPS